MTSAMIDTCPRTTTHSDAPDVDAIASIAVQLAARIRDVDPADNGRWLARHLPDPADWWRLCFVLAAAVPDDQGFRSLTAWTAALDGETPHRGRSIAVRPCGTAAAARRHRYHGEQLCDQCRTAERARDRERKRAGRHLALVADRRTA